MSTHTDENECDCLRPDCVVCMERPTHLRSVHLASDAVHPNGDKITDEERQALARGDSIEVKRLMPCDTCGKQHEPSIECPAVKAAREAERLEPLPKDPLARKGIPIATGFIDYFPDAIAEVARLSKIGNDQHNAGKPLHWDRSKSGDESDALMRHFLQRGTMDTDGVPHSAKVAWRALALLQKELEEKR